VTTLWLRNPNSGEIHKVYSDGTGKFSKEQCNADDAVSLVEISPEEAARASVDDHCGHCCVADTPADVE
jgi:hypothetical protein